jgi:hypothetical protein
VTLNGNTTTNFDTNVAPDFTTAGIFALTSAGSTGDIEIHQGVTSHVSSNGSESSRFYALQRGSGAVFVESAGTISHDVYATGVIAVDGLGSEGATTLTSGLGATTTTIAGAVSKEGGGRS